MRIIHKLQKLMVNTLVVPANWQNTNTDAHTNTKPNSNTNTKFNVIHLSFTSRMAEPQPLFTNTNTDAHTNTNTNAKTNTKVNVIHLSCTSLMAEPQPPFSPPLSQGLLFAHGTMDVAEQNIEFVHGKSTKFLRYKFRETSFTMNPDFSRS